MHVYIQWYKEEFPIPTQKRYIFNIEKCKDIKDKLWLLAAFLLTVLNIENRAICIVKMQAYWLQLSVSFVHYHQALMKT